MPASTRISAVAITLALSALVSGCTNKVAEPPSTNLELSLAVQPSAGSPSHPVSISLHAVNTGATDVWHCEGCGCGNGTYVTVLGPDGIAVALWDPNGPWPACADGPAMLAPNSALANGARFTGVLYVTDSPVYPSPTYAAPAGTYTVLAGVSYSTSRDGESIQVQRMATFTWTP